MALDYDYSKLKGKVIEKFGTREKFASALNISKDSGSLKFNGKTPWKQEEIEKSCDLLGIDKSEIGLYFFKKKSKDMEQE